MRSRALLLPILFAASAALTTTGCVHSIGPTLAERSAEELGPFPDDYQAVVLRWIEDEFRTYSEVDAYQVDPPRAGVAKPPLLGFGSNLYGWSTRVTFRARDRLGMPTGRITYALLIRDGSVVRHQKLVR